jgi:hypothetical protein
MKRYVKTLILLELENDGTILTHETMAERFTFYALETVACCTRRLLMTL